MEVLFSLALFSGMNFYDTIRFKSRPGNTGIKAASESLVNKMVCL